MKATFRTAGSAALKICVFGCYEDSDLYMRNRVLVDALRGDERQVIEVRPSRKRQTVSNDIRTSSFLRIVAAGWEQLLNFVSLAKQRRRLRGADLFFVPYPAYLDLVYLRLLTLNLPRRPLIVDAFLCLHDTVVRDRQMTPPGSLLARLVAAVEAGTLRASDKILIDTDEQKQLLQREYRLPADIFVVVPVGLDDAVWQPLPPAARERPFTVLFWGTFIPLHGVDTILAAASLLQDLAPDIRIAMIGDGQTADAAAEQLAALRLANVNWRRRLVDTVDLRAAIAQSHAILGVFGTSDKAGNVIPYKVHQGLACNRQVITREGPAMTRWAKANPELILVPAADPDALASAIITARDFQLAGGEANSRVLYDVHFDSEVIRKRMAAVVGKLCG